MLSYADSFVTQIFDNVMSQFREVQVEIVSNHHDLESIPLDGQKE